MRGYSKDTIDKIGNAALYLCERVSDMSKTKLLKLLYFLEEESVRVFNVPFFGIKFEMWQFGPVAKEVFVDLTDDQPLALFGRYIMSSQNEEGTNIYSAKGKFSDDEFSDNDISVMNAVVKKYGNKTAQQLVRITHGTTSAWTIVAKEHGLLEQFKAKQTKSSDVEIDFGALLRGCEKGRYNDSKEAFDAFNSIK